MQRQVAKSDFIPWIRLSESVLGGLMPHISDEKITELVSDRDWIAFPLPGEDSKEEIKNRPDPHIDLKLTDSTIRIGMRCNTVDSVEKLQNILESFHFREKEELVKALRGLDDDFSTQVLAKIKEHNYGETGRYEARFSSRSNLIDQSRINEMFRVAKEIREEGKERMRSESIPHNPVTPVIDIAFVTIPKEDNLFKSKLSQLRPLYKICLKVKTTADLRAEEKKARQFESTAQRERKYLCVKCEKEYTEEDAKRFRFCPDDGMRIRLILV